MKNAGVHTILEKRTRIVVMSVAMILPLVMWSQSTTPHPTAISMVMQPHECEPSTLTAPAGAIQLIVANRTRMEDLQLQLDRVGGGKITEFSTQQGKFAVQTVTLAAGNYELTEKRASYLKCQIQIH